MKESTPLLDQYIDIKKNYSDSILLFRMGDFYETFYDDAKLVSQILSITLTSREYAGKEIPLAGFPVKAADQYISRLVKTNRKVAVCEQLEEPSSSIKLVRRGVVEVITPGTIMRESLLFEKENNYISALKRGESKASVAVADISTGEMYAVEFNDFESADDYLMKLSVSEVICDHVSEKDSKTIQRRIDPSYFDYEEAKNALKEHFGKNLFSADFLRSAPAESVMAAGGLLAYLKESQNRNISQIREIKQRNLEDRMFVDYQTMRNLELFEKMNGEKSDSFIDAIDTTRTPMGARLLRSMMRSPYCSLPEINEVLNEVKIFVSAIEKTKKIREILSKSGDIERINSRIAAKKATPRDLVLMSSALKLIPSVSEILKEISLERKSFLQPALFEISDLVDLALDREKVLGGEKERFFKKGYEPSYDELLELSNNTSERIFSMEENERKKTGIPNLRIGYNSVMGYYIEVTNSFKDKVPKEYVRKQTLKNAERYINDELKEYEMKVLSAEEKLDAMERAMFASLVDRIFVFSASVAECSREIAHLDLECSYALNAHENDWVMPVMSESDEIYIEDGRHPVVEYVDRSTPFTPNSLSMDKSTRVILLTGPNMSGKSTYLRQNAIIIYMAHLGMYVPAKNARIPLTDRIFTRIGASDDISKGVSTFMAEMLESANIINNMTKRSFLVLDEIGRGTSTFDGLALAWAILEYIHDSPLSPKTLFATHYHELTELSSKLGKLKNRTTKVRKMSDRIVFLRKVIDGSTDESYGVEVAKMAGLPAEITDNAMNILLLLKESELNVKEKMRNVSQLKLFQSEKQPEDERMTKSVIEKISNADLKNTTPIEALLLLEDLKKTIKESENKK
ncbi:MAG: DNA mismatch repair protein MutS [bacterium]|nr:DNA mismatch repair protein MutS [bacterium]